MSKIVYRKCDICDGEVKREEAYKFKKKIKEYNGLLEQYVYPWKRFDICGNCLYRIRTMVRQERRNKND